MFLPFPTLSLGQNLPGAISLSPVPLMAEPRLPSCTWPSRKGGENPPSQPPGLTQCGVGWSLCPAFGPMLLEEAATGSSGQPSAVGSGRRYRWARSQTAPSLLVPFPRMETSLGRQLLKAVTLPPARLCSRRTLGPQPHLAQQLLCCHRYQVQPVQLPDTCPANFSLTAAAGALQTLCSPPEPAGKSVGQAGLLPGRAGSCDRNFSAKAAP